MTLGILANGTWTGKVGYNSFHLDQEGKALNFGKQTNAVIITITLSIKRMTTLPKKFGKAMILLNKQMKPLLI